MYSLINIHVHKYICVWIKKTYIRKEKYNYVIKRNHDKFNKQTNDNNKNKKKQSLDITN